MSAASASSAVAQRKMRPVVPLTKGCSFFASFRVSMFFSSRMRAPGLRSTDGSTNLLYLMKSQVFKACVTSSTEM